MNIRRVLLTLFGFGGALVAPARAQLIHLSFETEASVIFHSNVAGNEWDRAGGFVSKLDLYYDSQIPLGAWRDPSRNFWKMEIETHGNGRSFVFARAFDQILVGEDNMSISFQYFRSMPHEDFQLGLVFASPFSAAQGGLPLPPLPALGSTEYTRSFVSLMGVQSWFPDPDIADAYGGGEILSVTTTFIPIPEPSTYAIGALLLIAAVIGVRRRGATSSRIPESSVEPPHSMANA